MTLPTKSPAEALQISPEALEIANCYLEHQSIEKVSELLDIPQNIVAEFLDRREVRAYIDRVFLDVGFNNRHKMADLMDTLIENKLREMDEAGILSSTKDIADLLAQKHKMMLDILDREIKLKELENKNNSNIRNQTNIQINDGGGTQYDKLLRELLKPNALQSRDEVFEQ